MENHSIVYAMHKLELIRRMRIQTMLRRIDAYRGQGPVLDYIEKHPRCTQAEAADALGVSPPSITCSVKRMENSGLIVKSSDANDMRCTRLELTEKGRETNIKVKEEFEKLDDEMLAGISEEEKAVFMNIYERMAANLSKESAGKPICELMSELRKMEDDEKR